MTRMTPAAASAAGLALLRLRDALEAVPRYRRQGAVLRAWIEGAVAAARLPPKPRIRVRAGSRRSAA